MAAVGTFMNHIAVSVPDALDEEARADIVTVYGEMFGWTEIGALAKPDRFTLRIDASTGQYLNIRSRPDAMVTSGYEHLGVVVDDEATFDGCWARAQDLAATRPSMVLRSPQATSLGGKTFRLQYRLPLAIEVMWLVPIEKGD